MSRIDKRVCFSPDVNDKPTIFLNNNHDGGCDGRVLGNKKKRITENYNFNLPKDSRLSSPVRFLMEIGAKLASAIRDKVSMRKRSCRKVSSSSSLVRSYSLSDHTDSHRAEAVEDCIEFLHSSSSRERPSF